MQESSYGDQPYTPQFHIKISGFYVRPHLEYCAEVWNPKALGDIKKMEKVENKMSKLARNCRHLRAEQRNEIIGLSTHEKRRLGGDLIYMYKHIDDETLFTLRNDTRTRGHEKVLRVPRSNCLVKKHSFSARAINEWNALPSHVVNAIELNVFKRNIDSHML